MQFFNKEALKEIAGLVGHPICLHPSTENLTNIEVAKVYTVIDPRKPLPEAVNAQFESGEVVRIKVSSPWLPSLCSHCSKVGHTISRCPAAPPRCEICNSVKHPTASCRRSNPSKRNEKAPIKSLLPIVDIPKPKRTAPANKSAPKAVLTPKEKSAPSEKWVVVGTNNHVGAKTVAPHPVAGNSVMAPLPVSHDLSLGNLFVDFCSGDLHTDKPPITSSEEEDPSSGGMSNDEDTSDDLGDPYIEVLSKRSQKKAKAIARGRGPLNL